MSVYLYRGKRLIFLYMRRKNQAPSNNKNIQAQELTTIFAPHDF